MQLHLIFADSKWHLCIYFQGPDVAADFPALRVWWRDLAPGHGERAETEVQYEIGIGGVDSPPSETTGPRAFLPFGARPPYQGSRQICARSRTMTFVWQQEAAGLPCAVAAAHGLEVWCDGSGGERWGTGVYIPDLRESFSLGGASSDLGPLQDCHGDCDSAVAETLAMAHALSVADRLRANGWQGRSLEGRRGVHLVVDRTSVVAGRLQGKPHPPHLLRAFAHLERNASKLLHAGWSIWVIHKGMLQLTKTWEADTAAKLGRERNWSWHTPRSPKCRVAFHPVARGVLRAGGQFLLAFNIVAVE